MKKCGKCKAEKPLDDFTNSAKSKDGLHGYCRTCDNTGRRARRARTRGHWAVNEPTITEKWCWSCKETQPRTAFAKNRNEGDGLQRECRACCGARVGKQYIGTNAPDFPYVRRDLFQQYLADIDNCCEVTGRYSRQLVLDHDHHTGLFRGFISAAQNRNVGSDQGQMARLRREAAAKPKTDAPARLDYVRRTSKVEHQIILTMRLTGKSREDIEAIYDKNVRTTERAAFSVRYRADKTPAHQCEKV